MSTNIRAVVGTLAAVAAAIAWWFWADLYSTNLGNFIQGNAYWLVTLIPIIILILVAVWASFTIADERDRRNTIGYSRTRYATEPKAGTQASLKRARILLWAAPISAVVLLVVFIISLVMHGYDVRRNYIDAVNVVEKDAPEYSERAAFQVAEAQAAGNLGSIRGEIVDTDYVADQNVFASLVKIPDSLFSPRGYAAVQVQTVALTGQATSENCEFSDKATARLDGYFGNSLERQIAHVKRGLIITDSDAYGYCEDGVPYVVVPVKNHKGWFPAIEVPAGVVVYNGDTGEIEYFEDVTTGEIPGPVFPVSLAVELREATAAMGGYWDYTRNRVGFSDTSRDEADPNGENRSEFALATAEGNTPSYVSPLTLRGRSTAIAALGVLDASSVTAGKMNEYTVFDFEGERKANSAVADRLKSDYGDLPDWAAGMEIFEIAPIGGDKKEWVASLGREQNVSYRVRIKPSGDSCLETAEGVEIRCGKATATNGNGPGVALAPGETGSGAPVTLPESPENIQNLTNEELIQLERQLSDEIARRISTN